MTPLRFAVAPLALLTLAGCASMDESSASRVPPSPSRSAQAPDANLDYVARVEAVARRRGITVQWVNLPPKRVADRD